MAEFKTGDSSGLRLTPPCGTSLRLDKLDQIPLTDKNGAAKDPLADLAKEAKRARRNSQSALATGASRAGGVVIDFGITEAGGVSLEQTKLGQLLQQAKQHLERGEFAEALGKVIELLRDNPDYPEGLYLKALCHYGLGEPRDGLRALARLRELKARMVDVKQLLLSSGEEVRRKLRAIVLPGALQENHDRLRDGKWEEVIADTDELLALDPGVWEYFYLRADALSKGGKLTEAWEGVVVAFAAAAPKEPEPLINLREQVRGWIAQDRLVPALDLYREGQYAAARKSVAEIDPVFHRARIVTLFDDYLALLQAAPKGSPKTVAPRGPISDTDPLHFFLTRDDLPLMRAMRLFEQFKLAVAKGREALQVAPHFCYLHYLMSLSLYQDLMTRNSPTLDEAEATIREARDHAVAAQNDPEIRSAELVAIMDRQLAGIAGMRAERALFKPLIDQYDELMKSAENGLEGLAHHELMTKGLKDIQRKLAGLPNRMTSSEGKEFLQDFTKAIDGNLQRLAEIRPAIVEGEQVHALWQQLQAAMTMVQYGPLTHFTAKTLRGKLKSIETAGGSLRRRLTVPESVKSLDELLSTVREILRKIGG